MLGLSGVTEAEDIKPQEAGVSGCGEGPWECSWEKQVACLVVGGDRGVLSE